MMNNRKKAIAMHNASKKRFADIFTGCLSAGTLKQTQKKIKKTPTAVEVLFHNEMIKVGTSDGQGRRPGPPPPHIDITNYFFIMRMSSKLRGISQILKPSPKGP